MNVRLFSRYPGTGNVQVWKWPQAIVHSVEPIPESAEVLRLNVADLIDVHVYQYRLPACREKDTEVQFNVSLGFALGATSAQGIVGPSPSPVLEDIVEVLHGPFRASFVLIALIEIPDQYRYLQRLGYV
eukprot:gb/GECG01006514.1/.p1 GENE.gb/GECG01006514.1/~~gb/GECG01006514.1/.p1  ORF type:complete len:129 (+),score=13.14 gb/GECG01006514.1/:1-387(+)